MNCWNCEADGSCDRHPAPTRLTVAELRARESWMRDEDDFNDYLIQARVEGQAFALCSAHCEVGVGAAGCIHGHPSVLDAK